MKPETLLRLAIAASGLLLLGACADDELQFYPDRAYATETFCSDACVDARRRASCSALWDAVPADNRIEDCIASTPCAGGFGCPGDSLWEPQCYVDCVRMESDEVRAAVVEALRCEVPTPACE